MKELLEAMLKAQEFVYRLQQATSILGSVTGSYKWPETGSIIRKTELGFNLLKEAKAAFLTGNSLDQLKVMTDLEIFIVNKV